MAVYKVAQDVEADDKLIGPFSFRQFIYLIIVAIAGVLAWGLAQLFVPLAIIPLPVILLFGALALPLRKDQPMEVYLAALMSYYLKPRKRLWIPDGIDSLVEITAPIEIEVQRTKDISQMEAAQRFSYLADLADSGGWAIRRAAMPGDTAMISDVYNEAQQAEDVLDTSSAVGQSFNTMITQSDERRREELIERMHNPAAAPAPEAAAAPASPYIPPIADPYQALQPNPTTAAPDTSVQFNPYPTNIRQSVVQPLSTDNHTAPAAPQQQPEPEPTPSTSETTISPDIINLASNSDLSIETIAREAHRIQEKDDGEEVVISLR